MAFKEEKDVQAVSPKGKKPYRKPELQVYGDLSSITGTSNAGNHAPDNGQTPLVKT